MVVVSCLCAEWCDTCVDYRPGFLALAEKFPGAEFRWVDIENFPTIRVTRAVGGNEQVLFHGTQLPIHAHLERLLTELLATQQK
jgi:thiol-disulfide isomerase/thioredoxin